MKRLLAGIAAFTLIGILAGCNSNGGNSASNTANTPEGIEKQIAAIRNNPSMPQQAKDAAIASLQGAKAQGEAAAQKAATDSKAAQQAQSK